MNWINYDEEKKEKIKKKTHEYIKASIIIDIIEISTIKNSTQKENH